MRCCVAAINFVCVARSNHPCDAADRLPSFTVDLVESSVSGLSSGAYMAGQFYVAVLQHFERCSDYCRWSLRLPLGQLRLAPNECMKAIFGVPDPLALLEHA